MGIFRRRSNGVMPTGPNYYTGMPERARIYNDLTTYREPLPPLLGNYLTFWHGNQLPSFNIYQPAPIYRVKVREQFSNVRQSGGYNYQLARQSAADLVRRMQTAWLFAGRSGQSMGR